MPPFGPPSTNVLIDLLADVQGAAELAVAGVTTVYGKSFTLPKNFSFGIIYRMTGTTLVTKLELEVGNVAPTEGSANTNWAVAQIIDASIVASAALAKAVTPVVAKYGRLKLTGSGSNHADAKLVLAELCVSKNA